MKHLFMMTIASMCIGSVQAENLEHGTITSCAYQAGTVNKSQKIRQTEGDDWETFETKIKSIYKDSQGRDDLLQIAKQVFIQPSSKSADFIHDQIFDACVKRQQGTESIY
ncbi:hypothetical protein [Methylophaga nitratireducenticrescens]|nr:hypothetical protein [Methylophaga nitratireducenticrescens]